MEQKPRAGVGTLTASLEELMPLMQERLEAGQSVRFYPRGVSMRPLLREGRDSITLSRPREALRRYDIVLFHYEDHYVLHRIVGIGASGYACCGDHRLRCEVGVTEDAILAVVTAIHRGDKELRMDTWRYRAYVRFVVLRQRMGRFALRVMRRLLRPWRR